MPNLLDNLTWHAMSGPQRKFSVGTEEIRRYAPGFSTIVSFADVANPPFHQMEEFSEPGDHFYCGGWNGPEPRGWRVEVDAMMVRMIWAADSAPADEPPVAIPLGAEHAGRALELAELTKPGPFGIRTIELGEYLGVFEGERLVAMAGERLHAGVFREVSGVCTHPDRRGRGHARRLMCELIRRQLKRGETPCLHAMRDNVEAVKLYERMGFRIHTEAPIRIVTRL